MDDFTKECLTITVAFGISGVQIARIPEALERELLFPEHKLWEEPCYILNASCLPAFEIEKCYSITIFIPYSLSKIPKEIMRHCAFFIFD